MYRASLNENCFSSVGLNNVFRVAFFVKICERAFPRLSRRLIRLSNNRKIYRRPIVGPKVFFSSLFIIIFLFGTHNTICFFIIYTRRFFPLLSARLRAIRSIYYCVCSDLFSYSSLYTTGIPKLCRRVAVSVYIYVCVLCSF